ncbi:MAG: cysteine-rich CWC family protein [Betaproteobacteria bacterium]|nr:cysteine-rich CWC family protein [Betaproteobacteria bacterium]
MSNGCEGERTCPGCGRVFTCGMEAGWIRCWCAALPPLPVQLEKGQGCYCPDCMEKKLAGVPVKQG